MYQYNIPKKISVSAQSALDSSTDGDDELKEKLENISKKFTIESANIDESDLPSYQKLDGVTTSDDELKTSAENDLYEYKKKNKDSINSTYENEGETLNKNKETLASNYQSQIDSLDKYYENAKQSASDDALTRGLSRSSIVINVLDAFDQNQINTYTQLNKDLTSNLNEIDFQLNTLSARQEQALNDFDITYAAKLDSSIQKLKDELFEKQTEITKYNNEIEEQETNYKIKLEQLKNDVNNTNWDNELNLVELTTKYGTNLIQNYKYQQGYEAVKEYLSKLSSENVNSYLTDQENMLKNYLGNSYYTKLYNEYYKK